MKKVLLGFGALAIAVALAPMFAAFEAHVVNVTATIENALSVPLESIKFGTVFPQEHLDQPLGIALSQSFLTEDRVDDVEYMIRQKPKCAWSWQDEDGVWTIDENSTATGHVNVDPQSDVVTIDCGDPSHPEGVPQNATWGMLPSLCEYISKEGPDDNDGTLASFHQPWTVEQDPTGAYYISWNEVNGRLAKSERDIEDIWTIDLAVPCFGGYCAQDWADFVESINPGANASEYTQPISNEHKVFGCDLWVEVTEVSETPTQPPID